MYDDLWIEIQDAPGEIFDIDIDEEEVEQSFESKLNSKYDFWNYGSSRTQPKGHSYPADTHW